MPHTFTGQWISNEIMANLQPRNVFSRQLDRQPIDCSKHRNQHILFRKSFQLSAFTQAKLFLSADDYYKLYINGRFVAQGPSPSYHFRYNYNEIDITPYLHEGDNLIAVHTLYQGLINRVWQSGDHRHGFICDLIADGNTVLSSNETFRTKTHSAYSEIGICGYSTQFLECYDSRSSEIGFELPDFDDSSWSPSSICRFDDHVLKAQESHMLDFEDISPVSITQSGNRVIYDFGSNYVGYLAATAEGQSGDTVFIRCAQELNEDGTLRYDLRANCRYEEKWILNGRSSLDWYDYKAFRYAEFEIPASATIQSVCLKARHYPFTLKTNLKKEYCSNESLKQIWELCVHTQKYGVQEVIQDCMEREKGFYLGDGCYTALANMLLTHDDSMIRKLIDDAFASSFITDTLVTCMDCSFMQEIAEYPLMMVYLILWHYRFTHDRDYLTANYPKVTALLDAYRREYETDNLLCNLDKWCVVEWPQNFQHGYDVDISEGKVCKDAHVSINAYYIEAVRTANRIASILDLGQYRDEKPLIRAFYAAFYNPEKQLFRDGENTDHISVVGNSFVYGLGLCPDEACKKSILALIDDCGIDSLSFFCTFPILMGYARDGEDKRLLDALLNNGTWLRMLREGATTTFEGWGKSTKWNTSLFHLTMSYAAIFLSNEDLKSLFRI